MMLTNILIPFPSKYYKKFVAKNAPQSEIKPGISRLFSIFI